MDALEARADRRIGLLTGNIEIGASAKLRAVGIDPLRFIVSAFGSDHEIRGELPESPNAARASSWGCTWKVMRSSSLVIHPPTSTALAPSALARSPWRPADIPWRSWRSTTLSRYSPTWRIPTRSCARSMPREVEVKSVVVDETDCRRRIEAAGARLMFEGRLEDRRYDTADRRLTTADELLRVRTRAEIAVSTRRSSGRDQLGTMTGTRSARRSVRARRRGWSWHAILERIGYAVTGEIDRDIVAVYARPRR